MSRVSKEPPMKNLLLTALTGFSVAFAVGALSAPAEAAPAQEGQHATACRTAADCREYGQTVCGEEYGAPCFRGYCICP
jgi:hypothetical protein